MKALLAKLPFLHKNFRELSLELKIVFLAHLLTLVFCFFPWVSYVPLYGESYFDNAFDGPTKIIGILIFLISLVIVGWFVAKLFKMKNVKLPVKEEVLFIFAGFQQIVLIICAWSVIMLMSGGYDLSEIRFGIIFVLLAQIFGVVAAYLLNKSGKKEEVVSFFHQAEGEIEDKLNLFKKGLAKKTEPKPKK